MPTVPQDENRVRIEGLPNARSNVNYSPEAFGAGVGRAIQQVGGAVGKYAQQMQDEADTTAVMEAERELLSWKNSTLYDPQNGAYAQQGAKALGLRDTVLPEFDKQQGSISSRLTVRQQQMFKARTNGWAGDLETGLMRHAADQFGKLKTAENAAYTAAKMEESKLDGSKLDQNILDSHQAWLLQNGGLAAFGADAPHVVDMHFRETQSKFYADQVETLLAKDATAAKAFFDANKDKIFTDKRNDLADKIKPMAVAQESRNYVDGLLSGERVVSEGSGEGFTPQGFYDSVAEAVGKDRITQWTRPENASYGAKHSAHKSGYGIDLRNRDLSPEQGAEIVAKLNAMGLVAEDVRTPEQLKRHNATGPHIHVQVPKGMRGGNGKVVDVQAPMTPEQVLEHAMNDTSIDEDMRKAVVNEAKDRIIVRNAAETARDSDNRERFNEIISMGDPATPADKLLGPELTRWAAKEGLLDNARKALRERIAGTQPVTDIAERERLQALILLAQAGGPGSAAARETLRKTTVADYFGKLDAQDREWFESRRGAILSGDKEKANEYASEAEQLKTAEITLGIKSGDAGEKARNELWLAYRNEVSAWAKTNGRPPNATERDEILKRLMLPVARKVRGFFTDSVENVPAYAAGGDGEVPADKRAAIIERAKARGYANLTEQQIRAIYLSGAM